MIGWLRPSPFSAECVTTFELTYRSGESLTVTDAYYTLISDSEFRSFVRSNHGEHNDTIVRLDLGRYCLETGLQSLVVSSVDTLNLADYCDCHFFFADVDFDGRVELLLRDEPSSTWVRYSVYKLGNRVEYLLNEPFDDFKFSTDNIHLDLETKVDYKSKSITIQTLAYNSLPSRGTVVETIYTYCKNGRFRHRQILKSYEMDDYELE